MADVQDLADIVTRIAWCQQNLRRMIDYSPLARTEFASGRKAARSKPPLNLTALDAQMELDRVVDEAAQWLRETLGYAESITG